MNPTPPVTITLIPRLRDARVRVDAPGADHLIVSDHDSFSVARPTVDHGRPTPPHDVAPSSTTTPDISTES